MTIENLLEGYRRFHSTRFEEAREVYRKLDQRGQSPKVMIIACCDSRVEPATILDAGPGELFVARNVANLVPPCTPDGAHHGTSAALEFAVQHLKVSEIIVMGHAQCGGAKALLMDSESGTGDDFISSWMNIAREARENVYTKCTSEEDVLLSLEHEIVRLSLKNMMTFPWIREKVEEGSLRLHGWYFGIARGILYTMDHSTGEFLPVSKTPG